VIAFGIGTMLFLPKFDPAEALRPPDAASQRA
jgi:hypothetical protein